MIHRWVRRRGPWGRRGGSHSLIGQGRGNIARVMGDSLAQLEGAVRRLARGRVVIVALDGASGSGKSTLADALSRRVGGSVLAGDDFYRVMDEDLRWTLTAEEGAACYFDWQRLRDQGLLPLRSGRDATYSPYDWVAGGGFAEHTVTVPLASVIIVDGVYSSRSELADLMDLSVLVDTSRRTRDQRLASRDHGNDRWHSRWSAAESYYFDRLRPPASFDVVISGE